MTNFNSVGIDAAWLLQYVQVKFARSADTPITPDAGVLQANNLVDLSKALAEINCRSCQE